MRDPKWQATADELGPEFRSCSTDRYILRNVVLAAVQKTPPTDGPRVLVAKLQEEAAQALAFYRAALPRDTVVAMLEELHAAATARLEQLPAAA